MRKMAIGAAMGALAIAATEGSASAAQPVEFGQAAAPMDTALRSYAARTGRQLFYTSALVAGLTAPALAGRLDPDEALRRLLRGSPIMVVKARGKLVVLGQRAQAPQPTATKAATPRPPRRKATEAAAPTDGEQPEPAIIVTGSNIRGQVPTGPLLVLDRTEIDRSGYGTVAELVAALPQNFGGTATEDSLSTGSDRSFPNTGFGSGANLRGLGSDATLVLVNGRRMAGSGGKGDFTDLSSIPVGSIARIEILADGASAIYGSDAVGGVINMILKKDFEGAETRARFGSATSGSLRDYQFSQLAGTRWSTGHIMASYEYSKRAALPSADRRFTRSADLRPLGGDDFRNSYSIPATVLRFDPGLGTYVPGFAVPDGQDGTGLTPGSFTPGGNFNDLRTGTDILPRQSRHIGYVYAEQEASGALTLFAEGRYAHRSFFLRSPAYFGIFPVTGANPWFVSPTGAGVDLLGYSFLRELGPIRNQGSVETWSAAAGGTLELGRGWTIDAYVSRASERTHNRTSNYVNSAFLNEALGLVPDDPTTPFSTARDGFFNPYGSGASNSATLLGFIGQAATEELDRSRVDTVNAKADGDLFDLPGGTVRVAIGASIRWEHFERHGMNFTDTVTPVPLIPTDDSRRIDAGFIELSVPLVGADNAMPGIERLLLTAAVRHEDYQDFGTTTNPKLGLLWEPLSGLALRGSWGTSFRAPSSKEITDPLQAVTTQYVNAAGGRTSVLSLSGGNPNLKPEKAQAWTLGASWSPPASGFRVELNWFHTRFSDRIGRPAFENPTRVLRDPAFSSFVTLVDPINNPADLARLQALAATPGASISIAQPLDSLRAIVDGRYANSARTIVQGLDAQLSKTLPLAGGTAVLSVNGSWLMDFKTQVTSAAPAVERVGTVGNPSDLRARASLSWDRRGVGGTFTINHVGGYRDDLSLPRRSVGAWTTLDAQLRYAPERPGWPKGLSIALSITNLLATDPPFVNNAGGFGYDPANADPLGRVASLQLTKRW
ncbi:TonB-dependent receptor [Rhizorhabdus histidinilytica]